jgi:phage shock protein E
MKIKYFTIVFAFLISSFTIINAQKKIDVNSKEVSTMLQKDQKFIVLDVRTADEFKDGHIKGAINIDIKQPDALSKIDKLDHNAKYIVHCRTNHRSEIAVDHMIQNGFKNVYQMMDGITGWDQNNLPLSK